jgi:hypothetical protein
VKNSWGSNWGENGYFYVSYYDSWIGRDNAFFSAEGTGNYYRIYQHDPLGWVVSYGENSETAYFANVFTAQSAEEVTAVSFYTAAVDSRYQISVYKGVQNSPIKSTADITQSGSIGVPGYHTIPLSSAVPVQKGERFSVVVKLTTPGYKYPVAVEYPLTGFSSGARAVNGQSYVSSSGTTWTDLNSIYPNSNVCLKAFTTQGSSYSAPASTGTPIAAPTPTPAPTAVGSDTSAPTVTITAPRSYSSVAPGSSVQVTWSANDNRDVAGVDIGYSKDSGNTWVTAAVNLPKTGTYSLSIPSDVAGTFMIRATAKDSAGNKGSSTISCASRSSSRVRNVAGINATSTPSLPLTHSITLHTSQSEDNMQPVVSIESPVSYTSFVPGGTIQVIWSAADNKGVSGVDIGVSKDGGGTWNSVAKDLAMSGTFTLEVLPDSSDTLIIRVTAKDSAGNEGTAERVCTISSSSPASASVRTMTTAVPIPVPTTIAIDRTSRIVRFSSR